MRKLLIACLAFAFAVSVLHAEDRKIGQGVAAGIAKGAGEGAGRRPTDLPPVNQQKTATRNADLYRPLLIKPKKTKPITSGAQRGESRQ